MALEAATLLVRVGADTAQAESELSGFGGKVKGILGGIALGAVAGIGAAAAGLGALVMSGMDDAREAIAIGKQTEAVLKSTGGAAGMTAQSVADLATSMSTVTNFEDDAVQAGENMLLTFTNVGSDVFPAATEAMLDMSTAMGTDVKASAMQLGKALNDPIKGMTALQRSGVTFTEAQKKTVKAMVAVGDVAGAQKVILAELAKEFGGSAKAAADPLTQLTNAWGNLKETLATAVMPLFNRLAKVAMPMVQRATAFVSDAVETFVGHLSGGNLTALGAFKVTLNELFGDNIVVRGITGTIDAIDGFQRALRAIFGADTIFEDDPAWMRWLVDAGVVVVAAAQTIRTAWQSVLDVFRGKLTIPELIAEFKILWGKLPALPTIPEIIETIKILWDKLPDFPTLPEVIQTIEVVWAALPPIPAPPPVSVNLVATFAPVGDDLAARILTAFGSGADTAADKLAASDWTSYGEDIGEGFAAWWANFKGSMFGGTPLDPTKRPGYSPTDPFTAALGEGRLRQSIGGQAEASARMVEVGKSAGALTEATQAAIDGWFHLADEVDKHTTQVVEGFKSTAAGVKAPEEPSSNWLKDWIFGIVGSPDELRSQMVGKTIVQMGVAADKSETNLGALNDQMKSWDRAMMIAGTNVALVTRQLGDAGALKSNLAGALGDTGAALRKQIQSIPVNIPPFQRPPIQTIEARVPDFAAPAAAAEPPAWVTSLLGWADTLTTPPPWVATLTAWSTGLAISPPWITTLAAATALLGLIIPPWVPQLAGIIVSMSTTPEWVNVLTGLVARLTAMPAWVGTFRGAVDRLDSAPGWLGTFNSIVDKMLGWSPHISGFAGGVRNFGGGLAFVGEQGPELVALPRGSSVYSNRESRALAGAAGVNIVINANGYSATDARRLALDVARILGRNS